MHIRTHQWPWFAIVIRTGEEKSAALLLENAGHECFLPLSSSRRSLSGGIEPTPMPLFSGYLFCRMKPQNRVPVLRTPGVIQIVGVGRNPLPVAEHEIAAIQRVGKSGLPSMPWPYLRAGNVAELESGPLEGLTGILVRIRFGMKLVLSVNILQHSIAVDIDPHWIRAVQTAAPVTKQNPVLGPGPTALCLNPLETAPGRR